MLIKKRWKLNSHVSQVFLKGLQLIILKEANSHSKLKRRGGLASLLSPPKPSPSPGRILRGAWQSLRRQAALRRGPSGEGRFKANGGAPTPPSKLQRKQPDPPRRGRPAGLRILWEGARTLPTAGRELEGAGEEARYG